MAKKPPASHFCGRCPQSFSTRPALNKHLLSHPDSEPAGWSCAVCKWLFEDSLGLEKHIIVSGHSQTAAPPQEYVCNRCSQTFSTQRDYNRHRELGRPCCDAFHASDWKKMPREGYVDPDKLKVVSREGHDLVYNSDSLDSPSDMSDGRVECKDCKKTFGSEFSRDCHLLSCKPFISKLTANDSQNITPVSPIVQHHKIKVEVPPPRAPRATAFAGMSHPMLLQTVTLNARAPVSRQPPPTPNAPKGPVPRNDHTTPVQALPQTLTTASVGTGPLICNIDGCQRSYNSEPGLKMHQTDVHGVGGKALDLHGRDSWMLGQRERERLRAEGLLRTPTGPSRGGNSNRGGGRGERTASVPLATRTPRPVAPVQRGPAPQGPHRQRSLHRIGANAAAPLPMTRKIGSALEMEQAKSICGKTLRLLLQTDIFIQNDGKMSVSGIEWTRIGMEQQSGAVGLFDNLCHLPRKLQALEYVPAPKTFMAEYTAQYPVTEFASAPTRNPATPGLGIIAMACSKVLLSNGCEEVVKIAAIDVLTCRVLVSHLVCTNPNAQVAKWHSSVTGLASFRDMEDARQAGYKVLKGWSAARSALFKFIDKDTIIVGHNLRSQLDALRIIHGRAVDIVKMVEKAAQGPLSKAQVSLDSWCRDVANVATLRTDPVFGRDCVMSAFAAREIGLWSIKNREKFEQVAKQKTNEYQLVIKA